MAQNSHPKISLKCFESCDAGFDYIFKRPDLQNIASLRQVHGCEGREIESQCEILNEGDWLWTRKPQQKIGVMVADCTAILIFGQTQSYENLVAAIHAGWRGTAKEIIPTAMETLKLSRFKAWMSPSICQDHFEVGEEVLDALGRRAYAFARKGSQNKYFLDLKAFQMEQLKKWPGEIFASSLCTFCQPEFNSYRRTKGAVDARHLAWICIRS